MESRSVCFEKILLIFLNILLFELKQGQTVAIGLQEGLLEDLAIAVGIGIGPPATVHSVHVGDVTFDTPEACG